MPPPPERRTLPVAIQQRDLEVYGYTEGCPKCTKARMGHPIGGTFHSSACRQRLEDALREAGDRRIEAADRRFAERAVEAMGGDPTEPAPRPVEPSAAPPEPASEDASSSRGPEGPAADGPVPDPAEAMEEDAHDDEMVDTDPGAWGQALRRLVKRMPPRLQREAADLLTLYALSGAPDAPATRAVVELYSPPRVTKELEKFRRLRSEGRREWRIP